MRTLIAILPGLLLWNAASAIELTECQNLVPVQTPLPEYPSPDQAKAYLPGTQYMHVFVGGAVSVKYTVTTQGTVTDAYIIESTYNLIGLNSSRYSQEHFRGFLEMNVLPTINNWSYEPVESTCITQYVFKYEFQDEN